jgi:valyl-tRNA synthetase
MELPKRYDPKESEAKWQKYWEENKVYTFDPESKKEIFSIDTPPPTVSGKMHMGHAFGNSQQDFIARYKRMHGFNVLQPFGTDDNGLPTQILIEKLKKVRAKDMPRKEFVKLCLDTLEKELRPRYTQDWKSLGISCDFDVFYTTINNHSQKVSQQSFIDLYKKKRAYRTHAPAMVCPKCRTSIAQVELEDKQRSSNLNFIKADVEGGGSITFATTRPELMMACIAITVHPDDKRYKKLVGKFATIPTTDIKVPILADEMSKMDFGTGAVYWCPFGDANDMEFVSKHPELKVRHIMNPDGRLNDLAGKYSGMNSEKAKKAVLENWEKAGALVKQEAIEQIINVHERCGTPIEFVAMNQWMIKVLDLKEKLLELGNKLEWHPKHMKNRYDNWANGLKWDWNISRQIFFGVPFPVWYCESCDEPIVAKEEQLPVDPTEDKPPVNECPKCKHKKFVPETDIINTWATSSLTPTIVKELFKGKPIYDKLNGPMSLRPQGHDIISFWLFNTVVKSYLHYDHLPWNDCFINGWMLDSKGKKMSKSKGNVIEPQIMVDKYSADALRFMAAGCTLGEDLPFPEKDLVTGQRFVNKLWNASKFSLMHLEDYKTGKVTEVMDRWLLSKLQKLIKKNTENFDNYRFFHPKADTEKFFMQVFCDNYLEIVKDRLYNPDIRGEEVRKSGQYALHTALLAILKMMAPILPHITEEIYQLGFKDEKSIHIESWPVADEKLIDENAEKAGDVVLDIIAAVRKWKSEQQLSLKTEISELVVAGDQEELLKDVLEDIQAVTKAKNIVFSNKTSIETEKLKIKIAIKK